MNALVWPLAPRLFAWGLCGVTMALLPACGGESAPQESDWWTLQDEEDRVLLAELEAHDWPTVEALPAVRFYKGSSLSEALDAAIWDDPMLKRARRTIDGSSSSGLILEGEGAGLYAVGTGGLKKALAEAMEAVVSAVNGEAVETNSSAEFESRTQVEGSLAGFTFESMSTYSESTDPETGKSGLREVSRYRMRRGEELFSCAQDYRSSGDVDGRVKLQPGSMGFADVLRRVMEWEGASGARFSCVVVSGGDGDEFEVYLHFPTS